MPLFEELARTCRKYTISDFSVKTIIGILPHEKTTEQEIVLNAEVWVRDSPVLVDSIAATYDYRDVVEAIRCALREGPYGLQETLLERIARKILCNASVRALRLSSRKTAVLEGSRGIGVEIFREQGQ